MNEETKEEEKIKEEFDEQLIKTNKYERLRYNLYKFGYGSMKCYGNSMLPKLDNPSLTFFIKQKSYKKGDILFCKIRGKYIDSHLCIQVNETKGYLIANNKGHINGWTTAVYGKVVKAINKNNIEKYFDYTEKQFKEKWVIN